MKYVECPEIYMGSNLSLFLAGGISNCPNWQAYLARLLESTDLTIINPWRRNFLVDDLSMEREQITWEYDHLEKVSAVSFWFPNETLCPITLYELGRQSTQNKPMFIGVHPGYSRRRDVETQIKLARPEIQIVYSLKDLADQIVNWSNHKS